MFNIHGELLQGTLFFAEHGEPPAKTLHRLQEKAETRGTPRSDVADRLFMNDDGNNNKTSNIVDLTDEDAHYTLKGKFYYSRDAFDTLVGYLYRISPQTLRDQEDCTSLFKAYALAQHYEVYGLQNQIIDSLQQFYSKNIIPIGDILYVIDHWGDNVECFLMAYLIEQAAYEMAVDWNRYRSENEEVVALFSSGHKVILEQLFQASMKYAKPIPTADPARHKRDWRLQAC